MKLFTVKSLCTISAVISLAACKPSVSVGSLKSSSKSSGYDCDDHGDKCNFKDKVTNKAFKGKLEEDNVNEYIAGEGLESRNTRVFEYRSGIADFKKEFYDTAVKVFKEKGQSKARKK